MIPGLWTSKLGQEYDIQQVPFSLFLLKRRCTGRFMTGLVGVTTPVPYALYLSGFEPHEGRRGVVFSIEAHTFAPRSLGLRPLKAAPSTLEAQGFAPWSLRLRNPHAILW